MRLGILGHKVGMTQVFGEGGRTFPVTVVETTDCAIIQIKTKESAGYNALQVAIGKRKPQNVNKAVTGHYKKAGVAPKQSLEEIRLDDDVDLTPFKPGQILSVAQFQKGDRVDVTGIMKGRGFAGVMKRLGFHGKPASHGTSKYFRHAGSAGTNIDPGRILKNRGMPGHMGNCIRTLSNAEVIDVLSDDNVLLIKGGIPGAKRSVVLIRPARKYPLPTERKFV